MMGLMNIRVPLKLGISWPDNINVNFWRNILYNEVNNNKKFLILFIYLRADLIDQMPITK
jgi:hypothetical protein